MTRPAHAVGAMGPGRWWHAATPAVRLAIALSLAVHAVGVAGLVMVRGTRTQISDAPSPGAVQTVMALSEPRPEPHAAAEPSAPAPPSEPVPEPTPVPAPTPIREPEAAREEKSGPASPTSLFSTETPAAPPSTSPTRLSPPAPAPAPATPPRTISFAGLDAKRADRVVYVVDASGPMVSHWAWATAQLRLSLSRLDPSQKFQVLISRLPPAPDGESDATRRAEVLSFSGADASPTAATPATITNAIVWLSGQRLRGASDPLPGLSRALSLHPDLILLLSHSFTQGLQANVGRANEDILAELDRLNPKRSDGSRAVVIKTIQLGSDDPTGLLQAIAQEHGDGPGSYHVVTPGELEKTDGSK